MIQRTIKSDSGHNNRGIINRIYQYLIFFFAKQFINSSVNLLCFVIHVYNVQHKAQEQ